MERVDMLLRRVYDGDRLLGPFLVSPGLPDVEDDPLSELRVRILQREIATGEGSSEERVESNAVLATQGET